MEVLDRTPAIIELIGPETPILEAGRSFEDPGALWTDAYDGNGSRLELVKWILNKPENSELLMNIGTGQEIRAETIYRTVRIVNDDPVDFTLDESKVEENLAVDGVVGRFTVNDPNDPAGTGRYTFEILTSRRENFFMWIKIEVFGY